MKNDFRQLVDRNLSGLRWDETRQARVLRALEPEGGTSMKRKMTVSLALAAALVMLASVALAAVVLNYSPQAKALTMARNAVIETYGLTHTTLGLFTYDMSMTKGQTIIVFHSDVVDEQGEHLAGEYTVTIPDGGAPVAAWSHDNVDPAIWQSGDMNAPVWGQPQLETFLQDKTNGGTVEYNVILDDGAVTYSMNTPEPPAMEAEAGPTMVFETIEIVEVTPRPNELTETAVIELAREALMESFGLSEGEAAQIDFFRCVLQQFGDYKPRTWQINAYLNQDGYDWNMYVHLDAETGEILDIGMSTGGNG